MVIMKQIGNRKGMKSFVFSPIEELWMDDSSIVHIISMPTYMMNFFWGYLIS